MLAVAPSGMPRIAKSSRYCCGSSPAERAAASPSRRKRRTRYRSSAIAWYSEGVIRFMEQLYRRTIGLARWWQYDSNFARRLQYFSKGFLGFVVFVAVPEVEGMCAIAHHVRADGHSGAPFGFCPCFRGLEEFRA